MTPSRRKPTWSKALFQSCLIYPQIYPHRRRLMAIHFCAILTRPPGPRKERRSGPVTERAELCRLPKVRSARKPVKSLRKSIDVVAP
jgi:hypothetical protein